MNREMEGEFAIRPLGDPEEARLCAELMAASEPWITLGRTYEHGLRAVNDPSREVHIAWRDGMFAGFVILNLRGAFLGYIQTIAVTSERRNQGVGARLIAFAEDLIFRQSPNVFLCVSSFNLAAQRFYARLGYQTVGELKDYVVKGHSEILMRKTLGPISEFQPKA